MKILRVKCNPEGINLAIKTIEEGGTVVFPTDTVYGIGCDPYNQKSVESLYRIKKREESKLFPVLGYSKKILSDIAFFDNRSEKIVEKFWPGGITLVLKLKDNKLKKILNLDEKIAVRVPNNKCILSILEKCKLLIGTSANFSGSNSSNDPDECFKNFSGYDMFVDGGVISSKSESTIIEVDQTIKVLREGNISEKEIMELF